jgi:hypothetical protein
MNEDIEIVKEERPEEKAIKSIPEIAKELKRIADVLELWAGSEKSN